MTNFLILGDIHLADRAPSSCFDTYTDDLFDMIYWLADYAKEHNAVMIQAGDLFHIKQPSRNSHNLVQRTIEALNEFPRSVLITPGNHDMCVSEDTEALTDQGWKSVQEIDGTEAFAVLDPVTREMSWKIPNKIFKSYRDGNMFHFKTSTVDHLVTPEHHLYTRYRSSYSNIYKYKKVMAKDSPVYPHWQAVVAADDWKGISPDSIIIPPSNNGRVESKEIPTALAASFFGWYLSEGSIEPWRVTISQSRMKNSDFYKEISSLVADMGYRPLESDFYIRIGNAALSEFLESNFGKGSYNKTIPNWVKNWGKPELEILMNSLLNGDGHKQSDTNWVLTTASDKLVDDIQEICVKLGWRANATSRRDFSVNDGSGYKGTARRVLITKRPYTLFGIPTTIPYRGVVWCPDLDDGIWLSRRNGKPVWTGNSNDRLESIFDTQPLGTVFRSGVAEMLDGWSNEYPIYGVPWIQRLNDISVSSAYANWRAAGIKDYEPALAITHAPLYPPGQELKFEYYSAHKYADAMENKGSLYYGHVHEAHGVWTCNGVTFCNQGALSRGSLHEHNLKRKIAATMWNDLNGQFTRVEVPHKPATEVFRLQERDELKDTQISLEEFLSSVGSTRMSITSIESVLEYVKDKDLSPELTNIIETLLREAS